MSNKVDQSNVNLVDAPVRIEKALSRFTDNNQWAVSVNIDLEHLQFEAHLNGDSPFPAASLLKVPLALSIEKSSTQGILDLSQKHNLDIVKQSSGKKSILRALVHTENVTTEELVRIMLITSDEAASRFLRNMVSTNDVNSMLREYGFVSTLLEDVGGRTSVSGVTTSKEALGLLNLATDETFFPICASALSSSIINSRIPLGIADSAIEIAHKTGTLTGVAHDVAEISTPRGRILLAILSRNQDDTIVAGYEMGLFTNELLQICEVQATSTLSILSDNEV